VRRQEHIRLTVGEERAGDARRDLPLGSRVRPLRRRERPHLASVVEEVAREREPASVELEEVRDRAGRVAGSRQREELERPVAPQPVLGDGAGDRNRVEEREPVVAEVVVVVERPDQPVAVDAVDQLPFDRGCPDPHTGVRGPLQALHLVAMVMREHHVGDALDPERAQLVEHAAASPVDDERFRSGPQHVHVARVPDQNDPRHDLLDHVASLGAAGRMWQRLQPHRFPVIFRAWRRSSSTTSRRSSRAVFAPSTTCR
jgi:hypothetical protein